MIHILRKWVIMDAELMGGADRPVIDPAIDVDVHVMPCGTMVDLVTEVASTMM